jgi:hypothetical protein
MASGDTLLIFQPAGADYPSANPATLGSRNNRLHHEFDSGTPENVDFPFILPRNYAGGGLTVYLHWSAESATSGNVVWDAQIERIGDGQIDIDADSFAAAQSVTDAAPATSGFVTPAAITFTSGAQMDSIVAGEIGRLRVTRNASSGSDTMSGDSELHRIEIKET